MQTLSQPYKKISAKPKGATEVVTTNKYGNRRIHFRGGSYASTFAYCDEEGTWRFVKQCKIYNHFDKDLRLRAEIESVLKLPLAAQAFFPKLLNRHETTDIIRYEIEYVPYKNFAEVVRSAQHSTDHLSGLLENVYDKLFEVLYLPQGQQFPPQGSLNYLAVIRRRIIETKVALPRNSQLQRLLEAEKLEINGTLYTGLEETLSRAEAFLDDKPYPLTHNHGDLILQDILINPDSGDFRLVDGNGYSVGYMNDFAKTLFCLQTKYDMLYYGDYSLVIKSGMYPKAELTFTNPEYLQTLEAMNANFWQYLKNNKSKFFTDNEWRQTLLVLCGLQNIAVVMFHALHHKKHKRANAFLLTGIELINKTLDV